MVDWKVGGGRVVCGDLIEGGRVDCGGEMCWELWPDELP